MKTTPNTDPHWEQPLQSCRKSRACVPILLLLLLLIWGEARSGVAAMKLGIVADPEFVNGAVLLTAELSKTPGAYELLEREMIDHVLQEQGIVKSGATAGDLVKAGRILAADGLVLLQKRKTGEKDVTSIGWVLSVNTGVVLGAEVLPKAEKDQLDVLKGLIERCSVKMAVKAWEAVPVSIIPAETAGVGFDADREVFHNGLMLTLMREPSVFVLQREQLETLLFEREFGGAASEGFWGGANLVQCRVGPDPLNKGTYAATLTLKRHDGSSETWIQKAKSPQELAVTAANSIREQLKLASNATSCDPQAELAYFRKKLKRLYFDGAWNVIAQNPQMVDTAITLQVLGDTGPFTAQIAAFSPLVKACGGHSVYAIRRALIKNKTDAKAVVAATRQMMEKEHLRLQKLANDGKSNLASDYVTNPHVSDDLMKSVTGVLCVCYTQEPGLARELSALRQQMRDYLQLAFRSQSYYPHRYLLSYGEYFYDDPNEWLNTVETLFRPPFPTDPLLSASKWIHETIMQVPRHEFDNLFDIYADPVPTPNPETLAIAVPRLKRWTEGKEPALRLAGARILLRNVGQPVDRPAMARIAVQAMGELLPAHCRLNGPASPYPSVYNHATDWLKKVDALAHKELLELSIRTMNLAERADMGYLLTQPANNEEAALVGQACQTASARLGKPLKGLPFDIARRKFPEAFVEAKIGNSPQTGLSKERRLPERTPKLIWSASDVSPQGERECVVPSLPCESAGKLWFLAAWMVEMQSEPTNVSLLSIDPKTGASSFIEIPIQDRNRFEKATNFAPPLIMNEYYAFVNPLSVKAPDHRKLWMIWDRKANTWRESLVPQTLGHHFLYRDSLYCSYFVSHPERSIGFLELKAVDGSWKTYPSKSLTNNPAGSGGDSSQTCRVFDGLFWNRGRETLVPLSPDGVLGISPEFQVNNGTWIEDRPIAGGEALLSHQTVPAEDNQRNEFSEIICKKPLLKADKAVGCWTVEAVDPQTGRTVQFVLKLPVDGLELDDREKAALYPQPAKNQNGVEAGCTQSGLWFTLSRERFSRCRIFWLPWTELRREMSPLPRPDLLMGKSGKLYSMKSGDPESLRCVLDYFREIVERHAQANTVLVREMGNVYIFGQRNEQGEFTWRPTPVSANRQPIISPDGQGVRYIDSTCREIHEWRAERGEDKVLFTAPLGEDILTYSYCDDGKSLAWNSAENLHWQPASGNPQTLAHKVLVRNPRPITWSPDGKYLKAAQYADRLLLERTQEGLVEKHVQGDVRSARWLGNPTRLVWCLSEREKGGLRFVNMEDGAEKLILSGFKCSDFTPSADGETILVAGAFIADSEHWRILRVNPQDGSFSEVADGMGAVDFLSSDQSPQSRQ